MHSSKVSIIMPSYNTAKFISESIQTVINQTYTNWELIVVDDCSTDNTKEVVSKFLSDERIIYLENEKNSGAAISRNRALRKASGKYVAFLDSDDLWNKSKLEKMVEFMEKNEYNFAYHNYEKIDEESKLLNVLVSGPKIISKRRMYKYDYVGCLTLMYNAEFFGLVQIEDIKKNNDYAILLQLCKKDKCYLLEENLAKYRIRKKSISHDKFRKKLKSHYDLFRLCDNKRPLVAFWYASWNMFHGVFKKIKYEKQKEEN